MSFVQVVDVSSAELAGVSSVERSGVSEIVENLESCKVVLEKLHIPDGAVGELHLFHVFLSGCVGDFGWEITNSCFPLHQCVCKTGW